MTVIVKHNKTNTITDWTQAQLNEQIALGNFAPGTTLANIVLPSDWNNDHTLTGLGTMAEQDATAVAITGGSINGTTIGATTATTGKFTSVTTPSVTATTNDLTLSAISTGNINLNTPNGTALKVLPVGATSSNWLQVGNPSQTVIRLGPAGTTVADFRILAPTFTNFYTGSSADGLSDGANQMRISNTTSAVNRIDVTGGATGTYPAILGTGSDGTVGLQLAGKGGTIDFRNNGIGTATQFSVAFTASSVNYLNATGSGVTGNAPRLFALGTDTNISMAFQPKGTGAIDLAAGSSGVNISNGGTVTATTITTSGVTAYTSHPTPAITAPTTAGGVTATATSNLFYNSALATTSIVNGGTGYTVGNSLTVVGGTSTATAQFTVTAVSSGVVTAINSTSGGTYSVIPTGTLSVTGGSGTGFTFTINGWAVRSLNITNAGSGYIEQPTITFSGGGGSGAAAYATVGSGTTIQTLGSSLTLQTPSLNTNNTFLQVKDDLTNPTSQTAFYVVGASSGLGRLALRSSKALYVSSGSSNNISFTTGSSATVDGSIQFTVANTASAVNYVQVTGAATTAQPIISATGSDASVGLKVQWKGSANLFFQSGAGSYNQFRILGANNAVNNLAVTGTVAGSAPILSAEGTDTDIDLALTPKGTGRVQFGTHTANADVAISGFITIRDAGGTLRKLAVIT